MVSCYLPVVSLLSFFLSLMNLFFFFLGKFPWDRHQMVMMMMIECNEFLFSSHQSWWTQNDFFPFLWCFYWFVLDSFNFADVWCLDDDDGHHYRINSNEFSLKASSFLGFLYFDQLDLWWWYIYNYRDLWLHNKVVGSGFFRESKESGTEQNGYEMMKIWQASKQTNLIIFQ